MIDPRDQDSVLELINLIDEKLKNHGASNTQILKIIADALSWVDNDRIENQSQDASVEIDEGAVKAKSNKTGSNLAFEFLSSLNSIMQIFADGSVDFRIHSSKFLKIFIDAFAHGVISHYHLELESTGNSQPFEIKYWDNKIAYFRNEYLELPDDLMICGSKIIAKPVYNVIGTILQWREKGFTSHRRYDIILSALQEDSDFPIISNYNLKIGFQTDDPKYLFSCQQNSDTKVECSVSDTDFSTINLNYDTTDFTKEVRIGHSITLGDETRIVNGITASTIHVSVPFTSSNSNYISSYIKDTLRVSNNGKRMVMQANGLGGCNVENPSSQWHIKGENGYDQLRLETSYTPTGTADAKGATGDTAWDDNYFYIKTSAGWKRSALLTF